MCLCLHHGGAASSGPTAKLGQASAQAGACLMHVNFGQTMQLIHTAVALMTVLQQDNQTSCSTAHSAMCACAGCDPQLACSALNSDPCSCQLVCAHLCCTLLLPAPCRNGGFLSSAAFCLATIWQSTKQAAALHASIQQLHCCRRLPYHMHRHMHPLQLCRLLLKLSMCVGCVHRCPGPSHLTRAVVRSTSGQGAAWAPGRMAPVELIGRGSHHSTAATQQQMLERRAAVRARLTPSASSSPSKCGSVRIYAQVCVQHVVDAAAVASQLQCSADVVSRAHTVQHLEAHSNPWLVCTS